ncbi:MAG: rRNA maturation RNase YbeY [Acidobacterium ailaaui]|nr:rRNA maturation RNase YbeY [Pseudacidobacterium ailaaui]
MILIGPDADTPQNRSALKMRELRSFLRSALSAAGLRGEVSVLLTTDNGIRALNRDFRKKDKATDVLSFPAETSHAGAGIAGDLAISLDTARRQAEEQRHPLLTELKVLLLHGVLHLAGYDHESDRGQMARKEAALRKQLGLPAGLIQRSRVGNKSTRKRDGGAQ